METANASFGTALSCFFPEGASPVSMNLRTSTPSTSAKPRTFTPFSIIDIIKPDKYSPDESLGSDDSDRDGLHIDLDHTAEKENIQENDNMRSQTDSHNIKSQANGILRSPANSITRSQANGITRSQANCISRSADFSRSQVDGSSKLQNESVGSDDSDTDSDALHIDLDHTADENDNMRSPTNDDPKLSAEDISRPPDESVGSDDSDSDALHIDLDHTSDGEQYPIGHDIMMSPTYDNPKSRADDISGSPANDIPGSPAGDISGSSAGDISGSPAGDISGSPAGDISGLPAGDISGLPAGDISGSSAEDISDSSADDISESSADDISESSADDISGSSADDISGSSADDISESSADDISRSPVPPHQATTADNSLEYYLNQDPHHEPTIPEIVTPQSIQQSLWSSANIMYHMYPYHMVMPSIFPSVYPTVTQYLRPSTSQSVEGHLNSTRDVVTSPKCTGRVSPAHSNSSSDESRNRSPDTSPLPSSSPATTRTPRPRPAGGRTCYTQKQVCAMEQVFSENRCPDYDVIEHMSAEIGIPHKRIKVWFQNKRARVKKRVPDSSSLNSPQVAAMKTSSPGINHTMPQFPVSTPTMVSPFPGFPYPTMFSPTLC